MNLRNVVSHSGTPKIIQNSCIAVSNKRLKLNKSSLKNFISNVENMECIIYSQQLFTINIV